MPYSKFKTHNSKLTKGERMKAGLFACLCVAIVVAVIANAGSQVAADPIPHPEFQAPQSTAPGDWPTYGHDVSRTSYNPFETSIGPGNVGDLTQAWQANIGMGSIAPSGAPSVANGKVYVGSSVATGDNFFAYDAVTGGQAWHTSVGYVSGCFAVGVGSTSAISGTVVSVGGGDSAFYGLNANTGAQLWRNPMNVGASGFAWASPLLAYGRSYLGIASRCDNPSVRGEVRAVDMDNGTPVASQYFVPEGLRGAGIWNSPALSPDGSTLVVVTGEDYQGFKGPYTRAIVSMDPITLQILQSDRRGAAGVDQDWGATPIIFSDNLGRTLVGANHKNGTFYAYVLNNINAGPIWSRNTGTTVGMMGAYDPTFGSGGTLFIIGSSSRLFAVDPATGTDRWPSVVNSGLHGNMAVANGLIYLNQGTAGLKIVDETNGSGLRTIVPPSAGSTNSGVAVANGFIYWLSGAYLNAWSLGGTPVPTSTPTNTPTVTSTSPPTQTPTITPTGPPTDTPVSTATGLPTDTPGPPTSTWTPIAGATATRTPTTAPSATPVCGPPPFTDVLPTDYFYEPVRYLYCAGAISGYSDNTFRPYNDTTRGQLSKIVVLAQGWAIDTSGGPHFSDVPNNNPFYTYIETAYNHEIISGYSDGTFRWGNNVTRGQLSKIVVLAQGWANDTSGGPHFSDVPINHPFYEYIETAFNHGIISGYADGTFRPGANATRGQISKIVYNAIALRN
jgi:outer membrane protein assembly factor BamB